MSNTTKKYATVEFDHRDEESNSCPWPRWERMRDEAPIARTEAYGGVYLLSRYEDIFEALRESDKFSNAQVNIPRKSTPPLPPVMYDPPEHRGYREIVNPLLSPTRVAALKPWISERADRIITPCLKRDSFDFSVDIAAPMMYAVTMKTLGIDEPPAELEDWVTDVSLWRGDYEQSGRNIATFLAAEVEERRAAPGDDAISYLLASTYDENRPLDATEITNMAFLLVLAGLDTTTSALGATVLYLIENPRLQKQLAAADDRVWRLALDEFVRYASPVAALGRVVGHDTQFHGCPMQGNDQLLLLLGSANRDEKEFPDPDEVILDRFPNRHLGFGMGVHRCVGSHLAKATMRAVIERLLTGLDEFELSSPEDVVWQTSASTRGVRALPLVRQREAATD